jgi:hypothetical protein
MSLVIVAELAPLKANQEDDLESDDILAILLFAARLSQVKSIHKLAS